MEHAGLAAPNGKIVVVSVGYRIVVVVGGVGGGGGDAHANAPIQ